MFSFHYFLFHLSLTLSEMATVSSNELNSKLYDAAEAGDNAAVIAAIAAGADVNWKNEDDVSKNDVH